MPENTLISHKQPATPKHQQKLSSTLREVALQLKNAAQELDQMEDTLIQRDDYIKELEAWKKQKETLFATQSQLDPYTHLNQLINSASQYILQLPSAAIHALYIDQGGPDYPHNNPQHWSDQCKRAIADGYLLEEDPTIIHEDEPEIEQALRHLDELTTFIRENDNLKAPFRDEHHVKLTLDNRKSWNAIIGGLTD